MDEVVYVELSDTRIESVILGDVIYVNLCYDPFPAVPRLTE